MINNSKINYYRLLPSPGGKDRFYEFKKKGFVSIGWSELGDVTDLTREQIKQRYMETYANSKIHTARLVASYFVKLKDLKKGDVILIPHSEQYHLFKVEGSYLFDSDEKDVFLQQGVKGVFTKTFDKNIFSPKMVRSIGARPTITWLKDYEKEIEEASVTTSSLEKSPILLSKQRSFVYAESGGSITLNYSDNISKKRLEEFFNKVLDEI